MRNRTKLFLAKLAVPVAVLPLILLGVVDGPPPGRTGAPGEPTCWDLDCHSGQLFENSNSIAINLPVGMNYTPGVAQRLRVDINDAVGRSFGFQLSARDGQNGQAGLLAPIDATTQIVSENNVDYIEHFMARQ